MAEPIQVEDVDPTPPAEPVAAAHAEPVAPADPDEAEAVELPAGKHVPLAALKHVREENQRLKAEATQSQQLAQQVANLQGQLSSYQQIGTILQQQPASKPPATPASDPALIELARSLDFYHADGSPNTDRAQKHREIVQREARSIAEQVVGPIALSSYQDQSNRNWYAAVQEKLPTGQPIDQNLLANAWREVARQNPALVADPRVVRVVVNNVMAEQMRASPLAYQQVAPQSRPPVITEGAGAAPPKGQVKLNALEQAVLKNRSGLSEKAYLEHTKNFQPGRTNVLEDD